MQIQDYHVAVVGAGFAVLLIACANLGSIMLAGGIKRRREFATKVSLGATRLAIIAELTGESALLALAGGAAGVLLSVWAIQVLAHQSLPDLPWTGVLHPELNWRVFALAVAATGLSVIVVGLFPAIRVSGRNLVASLSSTIDANSWQPLGGYNLLVVVEIGLTVVLLMGAGLLTRAASRVAAFDFGYDPARIWAVYAVPDSGGVRQLRLGLTAAAASLSGVLSTAWIGEAATQGGVVITDETGATGRRVNQPHYWTVSPTFLSTMGIRILDGRDFVEGDLRSDGAVVVDQRVAQRLWPNKHAAGHLIKLGDLRSKEPWLPVVGVASNASLSFESDPDVAPETSIYVLREPTNSPQVQLIARLASTDASLVARFQRAMTRAAPEGRVTIAPWQGSFARLVSERRFIAALFGLLGASGLVLSAAGLFGTLAYAVSQRRREFALRVALGATPWDLLRLVMRRGLVMTLAGVGVGSLLAIWCSRLLAHWLYTVNPSDLVALLAAESILVAVSTGACVVPAIAASRSDPVETMRDS
jgi:putative ABC transport system permease protein